MRFTSRWTSTLILAATMRFSPHTEERKLILVQINQWWRKQENVAWTWSKKDDISAFAGLLCWKSIQKLSLSLTSVYFGCWFKMNVWSLAWDIFCRWSENCFCRLSLPRSELFCFSVHSKVFVSRFQVVSSADRFAPSYRSCFVAVPVFTTSSVATFPWFVCSVLVV